MPPVGCACPLGSLLPPPTPVVSGRLRPPPEETRPLFRPAPPDVDFTALERAELDRWARHR
ncbi:MAG: hypothetical protein M0032_00070, partial [Actinomycetota bacterium]|nr:hypothetical protein [Actinomycetota bacterium]